MILLDHRQRHVDASADAGRGPDPAVADEDGFAIDVDLGMQARQPIAG